MDSGDQGDGNADHVAGDGDSDQDGRDASMVAEGGSAYDRGECASGGADSGCGGANGKIIGRANGDWHWMWQKMCKKMVF